MFLKIRSNSVIGRTHSNHLSVLSIETIYVVITNHIDTVVVHE